MSTSPPDLSSIRPEKQIAVTSGCKINLGLRILDRLPNGYHTLATLFIPLATPCDTLFFTFHSHQADPSTQGIHVVCDTPSIDACSNTLTKAYAAYADATGYKPAFSVRLHKQVPLGAGLGGGSANAATVLQYLQSLATTARRSPLAQDELYRLAARIGADVPFFLLNTPAFATGIGEQLAPMDITALKGWTLLLVCPGISISTAWAFNEWDALQKKNNNNRLTTYPIPDIYTFAHTAEIVNDFEKVIYPSYPELQNIRDALLEGGARYALLSGTGSSIFGLFPDAELAAKAEQNICLQKNTIYRIKV